jgi:predicted RNA-binding protein associated with RNAse of E/G family
MTPTTRPEALTRGERHANSLALCDWELGDSIWDVSTLWLLRQSDWHAVWVSFLDTGDQLGWYVNFQEPFRRLAQRIQTMDLALDMIIEPDRSSWRWKDEEEFELFRDRGLIDSDTAERVLTEAAGVIGRIERDAPPFNGSWPNWRPDASWPIPELLDGWDDLSG